MRVIAGKYKSRQLKSVKSNLTRPTTNRNKETMFNIIGPYFEGGNVLDLFAEVVVLEYEHYQEAVIFFIVLIINMQLFFKLLKKIL